ncbi:MAG: hypothetical protein ACRDOK_16795 [Streptosporangiaceae bacterium]
MALRQPAGDCLRGKSSRDGLPAFVAVARVELQPELLQRGGQDQRHAIAGLAAREAGQDPE